MDEKNKNTGRRAHSASAQAERGSGFDSPSEAELKNKAGKTWSLYGLALNLGYMIITPILVFGIGGVLLDKYLKTFPIFVFVGFFLAMTSALLIVFVKMKEVMKQARAQRVPPPSPKPGFQTGEEQGRHNK